MGRKIEALHEKFMVDESTQGYVTKRVEDIRDDIRANEPPKFLKDGETLAKRWVKWDAKVKGPIPNPFNIDSAQQLADFFYNELDFDVQALTPKGEPSVNKMCLPYLGPLGAVLIKYRKLRDQRKFVTSLTNCQINGRLHPRMKIPGTLTGRLAGGVET